MENNKCRQASPIGQNITGTLPVKKVLSAQSLRCEVCGKRRPYQGRKWCKPCILKWQRSPERAGHQYSGMIADPCPCLDGVIQPHYAKAELSDLPESLVETFLALPDDKGLYLWGEPGRGKTHSCCAFVRHLWNEGWDVARISYEMLALRIRDSYSPGSKTSELAIITPLLSVGKLVVEDVGTTVSIGQQESEFSLRTFLLLLDQRLEGSLATFVTTNKSVEELGKTFDERVASRLLQVCEVVKLTGGDKRTQRLAGSVQRTGN